MKKWLFLFLLPGSMLFATGEPGQGSAKNPIGFVSVKPSYFWPQDHTYRQIYGGGVFPLGEVGFYLHRHLFLSAEGGFFHRHTSVTSFDLISPTTVSQVPVALYVGGIFAVNIVDLSVKLGPDFIYTKTTLHIPNMKSVVKKYSWGAGCGLGAKINRPYGVFYEFFVNYLFNRKEIHSSKDSFHVHLGGIQTGGGIGYRY